MIFAHDGLHDSVTRLAAPPFFYESLKREISLVGRNGFELTLIRIILESTEPITEASLISFADLLTNAYRLEDYKARQQRVLRKEAYVIWIKKFIILVSLISQLWLEIF